MPQGKPAAKFEPEPKSPEAIEDWLEQAIAVAGTDETTQVAAAPSAEPEPAPAVESEPEPQPEPEPEQEPESEPEARPEPSLESHAPEPPAEEAPPVEEAQAAEAPAPSTAPQPTPSAPPAGEREIIGHYEAHGAHYTMYADGSIDAETIHGVYHFASMEELRQFIEGE